MEAIIMCMEKISKYYSGNSAKAPWLRIGLALLFLITAIPNISLAENRPPEIPLPASGTCPTDYGRGVLPGNRNTCFLVNLTTAETKAERENVSCETGSYWLNFVTCAGRQIAVWIGTLAIWLTGWLLGVAGVLG